MSTTHTFFPNLAAEAPVPARGIHSQTLSDEAGVELVLFAFAATGISRETDVQECSARVWVPPVDPSCVHEARSVGRVPRATQHAGVGGIERRATVVERQDMVERQVPRWMGRMLGTIARAYVAVLADVARDHPP